MDNFICESRGRGILIKNEGAMKGVANWEQSCLLGLRVGAVCRNGSYCYWEWNNASRCFVPLVVL